MTRYRLPNFMLRLLLATIRRSALLELRSIPAITTPVMMQLHWRTLENNTRPPYGEVRVRRSTLCALGSRGGLTMASYGHVPTLDEAKAVFTLVLILMKCIAT